MMDSIDLSAYFAASNNKPSLERKGVPCGCYYCLELFDSSEITEWIVADNPCDCLGTAICPKCGVDSVIEVDPDPRRARAYLQEEHDIMF